MTIYDLRDFAENNTRDGNGETPIFNIKTRVGSGMVVTYKDVTAAHGLRLVRDHGLEVLAVEPCAVSAEEMCRRVRAFGTCD
jgi:hypothetical protein